VCIWEFCFWPVPRCKKEGEGRWHPPSLSGGSCVISAICQDASAWVFGSFSFPFRQLVCWGCNLCELGKSERGVERKTPSLCHMEKRIVILMVYLGKQYNLKKQSVSQIF
jgi:hypothetical protein